MDALTDGYAAEKLPALNLDKKLDTIQEIDAWTEGVWYLSNDDQRKWNSLQNTPNDIKLLTNLLLRTVGGPG
jgi:hypothetical protein